MKISLMTLKKILLGKRERIVDSYSESISLDDETGDERAMTANSDSSEAAVFEDAMNWMGWRSKRD